LIPQRQPDSLSFIFSEHWRNLSATSYENGPSPGLNQHGRGAGLRVGTSITEGTANFLVNRRMNKSQQMRWSRRGADLLLQVRCAGFNGKLGSSFGQLFQAVDPASELTMAA
jgi:hypothetical protein